MKKDYIYVNDRGSMFSSEEMVAIEFVASVLGLDVNRSLDAITDFDAIRALLDAKMLITSGRKSKYETFNETLSNIANFRNMPTPSLERLYLTTLVMLKENSDAENEKLNDAKGE